MFPGDVITREQSVPGLQEGRSGETLARQGQLEQPVPRWPWRPGLGGQCGAPARGSWWSMVPCVHSAPLRSDSPRPLLRSLKKRKSGLYIISLYKPFP